MDQTIFSPLETKIIDAIGKKHWSTMELVQKIYGNKPPLFAANAITNAVRVINKKCEYHRFDWFINGAGSGRSGKTMWFDSCKRKKGEDVRYAHVKSKGDSGSPKAEN